jgi:hypothetical protein
MARSQIAAEPICKPLPIPSCPLHARLGEPWRRLTVTRGQTSQGAASQRVRR